MVLGIYGSGGCGREVKDLAEVNGLWEELVFIDDINESGIFEGIQRMPFASFCESYDTERAEIIIALGEPEHRIRLYDKVKEKGYPFANIIAPTVQISSSAKLGKGIILKAQVTVSCNTIIEDNVRVESFVAVGHDCIIRKHGQISSGVMMGGGSEVGEGTYIGMNVPIKENVKIGSNSVVGMGSVVQREIPDNVIALGNPARAMKHKDHSRVFES